MEDHFVDPFLGTTHAFSIFMFLIYFFRTCHSYIALVRFFMPTLGLFRIEIVICPGRGFGGCFGGTFLSIVISTRMASIMGRYAVRSVSAPQALLTGAETASLELWCVLDSRP